MGGALSLEWKSWDPRVGLGLEWKSIPKHWKSSMMKDSQLHNCKFLTIIIQPCWYNIVGKPVMENSMYYWNHNVYQVIFLLGGK